MIRYIVFDFDDTLIHSTRYFVKNTAQAARDLGIRVPSQDEIIAYGRSWDDFIVSMWPDLPVERFKKRYRELAGSVKYDIIEGANETLEELNRDRELFVLSKRTKEFLPLRIYQTGLKTHVFKGMLCNEDVAHKKPDPRAFDEILGMIRKRHGRLEKNEVLSVGDRIDDMKASEGAGINFVGVLTGYTKRSEFLAAGVDNRNVMDSVVNLPYHPLLA